MIRHGRLKGYFSVAILSGQFSSEAIVSGQTKIDRSLSGYCRDRQKLLDFVSRHYPDSGKLSGQYRDVVATVSLTTCKGRLKLSRLVVKRRSRQDFILPVFVGRRGELDICSCKMVDTRFYLVLD